MAAWAEGRIEGLSFVCSSWLYVMNSEIEGRMLPGQPCFVSLARVLTLTAMLAASICSAQDKQQTINANGREAGRRCQAVDLDVREGSG